MKRFLTSLVVFVAGLIIGAFGYKNIWKTDITPSDAKVTTYTMPHMKRPNLVVADLQRSKDIYEGVLGLTASPVSTSAPDSFSYPVFNIPQDAPIRSMTFHEPGEQRVMALTELASLDLPKPHSAPFMSTVVIGITDLEGKFAKLEDIGLKVTETRIAGGADFKFIEQAFIDPDGHLIVCYEILPGK